MADVRVLGTEEEKRSLQIRLRNLFDALKLHESLFALPFAYTGMFLAANGVPSLHSFVWITLAMVGARNFGMAMNRVIDKAIDAANPKNRERHIPSGRTKVWEMLALSIVALLLLMVSAWQLNLLSFILAWPAAAYLVFYSYTKRFSWASNLFLGWALAIGPAGAWIGVTGQFSGQMVLLSVTVFLWASAFDILHHLPSRDFYIQHGLHSVPQKFGIRAALVWARTHDALAVGALCALGIWMQLGFLYYIGVAIAAGILAYKHTLVSSNDLSRLGVAFFRFNALVSAVIFVFTVVDVLT